MTSNIHDCNTRMVAPAIGNYNSGRPCTLALQAREYSVPILYSREGVCALSTVNTAIRTAGESVRKLLRTSLYVEIKIHSDRDRSRCRERIPCPAAPSAALC